VPDVAFAGNDPNLAIACPRGSSSIGDRLEAAVIVWNWKDHIVTHLPEDLNEEAQTFNRRIEVRTQHGFIPDLRRSVKCEYFYKSFFRDPYFIDIYLGDASRRFLGQLHKSVKPGARVLDAGCGPGFFALEMARSGYHVVGIDIADKAIDAARQTAATNPFRDNFGSLEYRVMSVDQIDEKFDAVLFSGVLHHMTDPGYVLDHAVAILNPQGVVLGHEPSHEQWGFNDAAQVALIRGLLALTGHWYESAGEGHDLVDRNELRAWIADIHTEYRLERDESEPGGQSPHDLASTGTKILDEIRKRFDVLEEGPQTSFIHRTLGGLRGDDAMLQRIADFLANYERVGMAEGFLSPQSVYFLARKKPTESANANL
jgi:2-polyprenyl-3-methyl-5-hydroxy-6-metoxy-1,4-benzoquinol methylase